MLILGIPMHVIYGGSLFPSCRLRIVGDTGTFAIAGICDVKNASKIALAYTIDGYIYGLETDVAEVHESNPVVDALPIRLPLRIFRIERRKSYRATCPKDEPVRVVLLSGDGEAKTEALVVSEDSMGLSLPPGASVPAIGSVVTLSVSLPHLGNIVATGSVHFIRDSSGNQGLVVRLAEMTDPDLNLLRQYVRSRRIEARADDGAERRESSFIVTRTYNGRKHAFWCPAHFLGSIDMLDEALKVVSVDALEFL